MHTLVYHDLEPNVEAITQSLKHTVRLTDEEIICDIEFNVSIKSILV